MMVFHGLLTKGRPLEARYKTKDLNGKPRIPWILAKKLLLSFFEMFLTYFFRVF